MVVIYRFYVGAVEVEIAQEDSGSGDAVCSGPGGVGSRGPRAGGFGVGGEVGRRIRFERGIRVRQRFRLGEVLGDPSFL